MANIYQREGKQMVQNPEFKRVVQNPDGTVSFQKVLLTGCSTRALNKKRHLLKKITKAPVQVESRAPVQLESRAPVPKVGEYFDAEALFYRKSLTKQLARYSDRTPAAIESIRGKYLVIICISLPLTDNGTSLCYRIMKAAYGEICKKDDFEMITVAAAKMDGDDVTAFEEFFTTVPGLVVPYVDFDSRGYVCDTLGFGSSTKPVTRAGVILDKDGRVLQNDDFLYSFNLYGAAFYPFTNARVHALEATLDALNRRLSPAVDDNTSGSLMDLLSCEPSHKLKRLRRGINDEEEISVGELSKNKCVGVYFCFTRRLLPNLASVYAECKARNLEFEIVVACQSLTYDPPDIQDFERVSRVLESTSSWWMLDWTDANSRWLRMFCCNHIDNLFIVRPEGSSWERHGRLILHSDGITSYPFTRDSIFERITSITVDSLLKGCADTNLLACLRGKNVLVYFRLLKYRGVINECPGLEFLRNTCNNDNCNVPDLQVVFVSEDDPVDTVNLSDTELAKWHVLPALPLLLAEEVVDRAFTKTRLRLKGIDTVVAFGKDGRLLSRSVEIHHSAPKDVHDLFNRSQMAKADADVVQEEVEEHFYEIFHGDDEIP